LESSRKPLDDHLLTWMTFETKNPKGSVRMQVPSYERALGFTLPMPPRQQDFTLFAAEPNETESGWQHAFRNIA
jgi:hypothetical protein